MKNAERAREANKQWPMGNRGRVANTTNAEVGRIPVGAVLVRDKNNMV